MFPGLFPGPPPGPRVVARQSDHGLQPGRAIEIEKKFLDGADKNLLKLSTEAGHADWVRANFITYDTEILSAAATPGSPTAVSGGLHVPSAATWARSLAISSVPRPLRGIIPAAAPG